MFEVEALSATVDDFRLEAVDLSLAEGSCHALLGPSGSGKSTCLHAILGVIPMTSGWIRMDGVDITRTPMEQRKLGYVPQQLGLFPHLTVRDNLHYSRRARKLADADLAPLLTKLIEITGIGPLLERRISTLSGGERQRVALVRALAAKPKLVLLDEPFTALNETLRKDLWWLLMELRREQNLTILLITHDLTEAYVLADQITVLIDGRVAQSGPKEIIYHQPASLAVARFLGIKNFFPATVVAASGGNIVANCPCLGHSITLPGQAPVGKAIHLGIRSDAIHLHRHGQAVEKGDCLLEGNVHRIDMGASVLMRFQRKGLPAPIEIMLPRRMDDAPGTEKDPPLVSIRLPTSAFFWVENFEPSAVGD